MTLACAFIGTSTSMFEKPNRNAHAASAMEAAGRALIAGILASTADQIGAEIRSVRPVPPIRGGRRPAAGIAAIAPRPAASRINDSPTSERENSALT
jgi:hypothetical protein